jgi:uncharacterized surface protein with fasciclin (FAS1) repeats
MKLNLRRTSAAGLAVIALSAGLAACGSDSDDSAGATDTMSSTPSDSMSSSSPSESATTMSGAGAQTFGPACDQIPKTGKGSFDGMASDPVATAASNNPLLSTLVTAVGAVDGLAEKLNSAPALTVFAPVNDAFAAIPKDTMSQVMADQKTLGAILSHHVIGEQLDPNAVVGTHKTLNGDTVTVAGDPESGMTVDGAKVLCGNIQTGNATVYVIDTVLMPPAAK